MGDEDTGKRLGDLRRLLGWSQRRLAKELRVTPAAVSQWESGRRTVPGPVERLLEIYERNLGLLDPTGRTKRAAPRAEMASRLEAASLASISAAHGTASEIKAAAQLALAKRLGRALGGLKGLPMKLGQLASQLHFVVPAPMRDALRTLQDRAPAFSERDIVEVFTASLGRRPDQLFARWDPKPIAAASIGQVHRAALADGTEVAVKIQYPGIRQAIEHDIGALSAFRAFIPAVSEEVVRELRDRVLEECDYIREAADQEELRALYAGVPNIFIPRVHRDHSGDRVLTSDYVDGQRFHDFVRTKGQPERDRAGEIIFRFATYSLLAHGVFHADPHPGNYLFLPNGDVAFLDFGCVKRVPRALLADWGQYVNAVAEGRRADADRLMVELGFVTDAERFDYDYHHELFRRIGEPILTNAPFRFSKHFVERNFHGVVIDSPNKFRFSIPPHAVLLHRLIVGMACVLAELEARSSWRQLLVS